MGKIYTADSFKTTTGEDLVLSKQEAIIKRGSLGNADYNLQNWQFDTNDRLHFLVIGDSISMGAWADVAPLNWFSKGFSGMLKKALLKTLGDGGMGFIGLFDTSYWVKTGSWGQNTDFAPFGACYTSTVGTDTFTLSNIYGDSMEIYYVNNSAVTFSYSIDGGSFVTVNSSAPYSNQSVKVAISLGTLASHSVVIKGATVGTLFLQGASVYTGTKGIVIHKIAKSGETAKNCSVRFTDRFSMMAQHFPAKLTFINFLANDFVYQDNVNNSVPNFQINMNTMVAYLKSIGSDLIVWQPPKGTKAPLASTYTLKQYEDASKAVAISNNCAWVDFHNDWGDSNTDKMYDDQHPNEKGHKFMASLFLRVIRLFS